MGAARRASGLTAAAVAGMREAKGFLVVAPFRRRDRTSATGWRVDRMTYPADGCEPYSFDEAVVILAIFCNARVPDGGEVPPDIEPYAVEIVTFPDGARPPPARSFTLRQVPPRVRAELLRRKDDSR